jgi:hypothetical protein
LLARRGEQKKNGPTLESKEACRLRFCSGVGRRLPAKRPKSHGSQKIH